VGRAAFSGEKPVTVFDLLPFRRRDRADDERQVDELLWAWRTACVGSGLCTVVNTATGPTESVPRIIDITLGPPLVFLAELLPGQIAADIRAVAHRLAGSLGAVALRIEPRGLRHVRIECLTVDPLIGEVARTGHLFSACSGVMLGRDEQGGPVKLKLDDGAHIIVQGSSGSGKSTAAYGWLAQLAGATDGLVVGSDITGKLLEPWSRRPGNPGWHALGTKNLVAHVNVLERAVREMDDRIDRMPPSSTARRSHPGPR
jgi:hypothetical protein